MGNISTKWWIVIGIASFFVVVISSVFTLQAVMKVNESKRNKRLRQRSRQRKLVGKTRETPSPVTSNSSLSQPEKLSIPSFSSSSSPSSLTPPSSAYLPPMPSTRGGGGGGGGGGGYAVHPLYSEQQPTSYDSFHVAPSSFQSKEGAFSSHGSGSGGRPSLLPGQ